MSMGWNDQKSSAELLGGQQSTIEKLRSRRYMPTLAEKHGWQFDRFLGEPQYTKSHYILRALGENHWLARGNGGVFLETDSKGACAFLVDPTICVCEGDPELFWYEQTDIGCPIHKARDHA